MNPDNLYLTEKTKENSLFVRDLVEIITGNGFIVHNENVMEMSRSFGMHGVEVSKNFDLHMIQICKPDMAARSLQANPERTVLMPKFIMTFTDNCKTQIRFLRYSEVNIRSIVDDEDFPASLAETYRKIISVIEEAR